MNIDPNMPTLTLGLSEWIETAFGAHRRFWLCGDQEVIASQVTRCCVEVKLPGGFSQFRSCCDVEDGKGCADQLLREWIEGGLQ